jgi:hypothetical protein
MVFIFFLVISALVVVGALLVSLEYQNKSTSRLYYKQRMDPQQTEPGLTTADTSLQWNATPAKVYTGIYVDRIVEISMRELSWTVDCYIWFNWTDSMTPPGDNFQVVDGWIESKEKKDENIKGNSHFVLYRIVARITSIFDETRFPCDDHLLTICIEDPAYTRQKLLWIADTSNSTVSSRVKVPGYLIYKTAEVEKPHSYKTPRGDPRLAQGSKATFSQFRMGVWIKRDGWGFFLKMFLPLFVAVAVASLSFFITPTDVDPRFGLGVGALFAAVANSYITSSMLPNTGLMSLADLINIIGTVTILLTLIESTISLHLYDRKNKQSLSRYLDMVSFYFIMPVYAVLNIALALTAAV